MTGLGVAALVAVALWLTALSVVVLLCVRHLGLVTARLTALNIPDMNSAEFGIEVGERIPVAAQAILPDLTHQTYLLFVDAGCVACRQVVVELDSADLSSARIVAVAQREDRADEGLAALLPRGTEVVLEPYATEIADMLDIELTPTVLEIQQGYVVGKALLRGVSDLVSLVEAQHYTDVEDIIAQGEEFSAVRGEGVEHKAEVYGGQR